MNTVKISILPLLTIGLLFLSSCANESKSPGLEYMPDMYRSPSIEEYVDYGEMQDRIVDSIANRLSAMVPPKGTIPYSDNQATAAFNFPYPYPKTDEGYALATKFNKNPILFNEDVYNKGKEIFGKFCIHCHGPEGKGQGSIVVGGAFPPPPAYSKIADLTQGKMFHTLMYGKGNMGSHSSQLNKEEMWTVAHYVATLRDEKSDYASFIKVETPSVEEENIEE